MRDYYVLLTGSKNNAGDYLIKHRGKQLLNKFRQDRELIDFDAWVPFDSEALERVNNSKALILLGGPSVQRTTRPNIYPLTEHIDDITVPILTMGVGWKSQLGSWEHTHKYELSSDTINLFHKINTSGYLSSVRDYHTLNTMSDRGYDNFLMTGCPAYYDLDALDNPVQQPEKIDNVAFSLGVSFVKEKSAEEATKKQIIEMKEYFDVPNFKVVFHHSLNSKQHYKAYPSNTRHFVKHKKMEEWLIDKGIDYVDISGSATSLISFYQQIDLHVGYRVHAHIFMASQSKPSILIAEDGRGKAIPRTVGGNVVDAFSAIKNRKMSKALNRLFPPLFQNKPNKMVCADIKAALNYEILSNYQKLKQTRSNIECNLELMKRFIQEMP